MLPTMATPSSSSPSALTAITPSATTTSEPGTTGANRRSPSTTASDATPTTSVRPSVSPRLETTSQSCSKKSPSPFSMPKSFGTWPMMIVSARPTMNPFSTGSEMKLATKPSRSRPATTPMTPVVMASAAVIVTKASSLGLTTSATAAAESAAVADIGPTMRWRDEPKTAYSSSAPGAA